MCSMLPKGYSNLPAWQITAAIRQIYGDNNKSMSFMKHEKIRFA